MLFTRKTEFEAGASSVSSKPGCDFRLVKSVLALENTGKSFLSCYLREVGQTLVDAGCDADLPGAPPWLPPGSSPHPSWWAYSPPATCLRWVRRCGRGARSAPCSWPPRMPMAGAPTDLVLDAPPRTPCACSPLQSACRVRRVRLPGKEGPPACRVRGVPPPVE